ncbi:ribonuclease H-like domain-containing protein [Mycena capillaripes]|nr:ribonuclease H-like domain-containing protein [Mycena capillaripes]
MSVFSKATGSMRKILLVFRPSPDVVGTATDDNNVMTEDPAPALTPFPQTHTVYYVTTESQVNAALRQITTGPVGFDTEFTARRPTAEEQYIIDAIPAGAARKYAITGWQVIELKKNAPFAVAWGNIGLRLIQIARGDEVWVLDMWKIKAFPKELRRILLSQDIAKVGVGIISDITVIWNDLRTEMMNLVDAGMMAKLLLAEKYPKTGYGNLSLKTSVQDVLGFSISKELSESDWSADELTDEQKQYAALDAVASLRLHDVLSSSLERRSIEIKTDIPSAWYTFNTKIGEPTRVKRAVDGTEIIWKATDCTWYGGGKFQGYP